MNSRTKTGYHHKSFKDYALNIMIFAFAQKLTSKKILRIFQLLLSHSSLSPRLTTPWLPATRLNSVKPWLSIKSPSPKEVGSRPSSASFLPNAAANHTVCTPLKRMKPSRVSLQTASASPLSPICHFLKRYPLKSFRLVFQLGSVFFIWQL